MIQMKDKILKDEIIQEMKEIEADSDDSWDDNNEDFADVISFI